ncbi:hypothetical protein [Streptomyces sp. A30]|uniref:hypothetical protein n=1 Tax=Streptomyces sp. A30 TaxID=2789273 RepID=UPI0039813229
MASALYLVTETLGAVARAWQLDDLHIVARLTLVRLVGRRSCCDISTCFGRMFVEQVNGVIEPTSENQAQDRGDEAR